jgi:uncharacterized protein (DUF362 family)
MGELNRRQFLLASAALAAAPAAAAKPALALVHSSHPKLRRPASPEDPLDAARVRDMVWTAIDYAGGLEQRILPGSWVVIKPNLVFLRPQPGYRTGDVTDLRVIQAVLEYVAERSRAARITIAEGGSYRGLRDPAADNVVSQNDTRVDALGFDWGADEFPGAGGSVGDMLRAAQARFSGRRFDYVDLNYDAVRDSSGRLRRIPVARTARGVGAFGARPDYYVTKTITGCDFLVSVPVMKIHNDCGITGCLKNYVGTAPRQAYAEPGKFWNVNLHAQHAAEQRIDPFITDLASFHPPDFCVVDGIRGLQYQEHKVDRPDQMVRSNLVLAGADPVGTDALAAHLMGFLPEDIDFLHMAQQREMGTLDLSRADVRGDDPGPLRARWGKPRNWYGRCNREWRIAPAGGAPLKTWRRVTAPGDTLRFDGGSGAAAAQVIAEGHRKAYLWVGARGRVEVEINGQQVLAEECFTRYRVGQFQQPVELRPGENRLLVRVRAQEGPAQVSVLLAGPRNDGDSVEGIRWSA